MIPSKPFRHTGRICAISCAAAALIALTPVLSAASESSAQPESAAQADFIEFLEYLGSWDGQEDQWQQFLSDAGEPTTPEELMVDAGSTDTASASIP